MFINWKLKEIHIKVVYYGPPLSGKTTNLEQIHAKLPTHRRSDLVSVKTREDRTLFFDFLQMELGQIRGLQPKFKLYTVPGQVYYEATRRLVLRDADGLVFVADSATSQLAANRRAIKDMWQQVKTLERENDDMPFVLQCNKQDLSNAVKPELLSRFLLVDNVPIVAAEAINGKGVTETLKLIISQVMARI